MKKSKMSKRIMAVTLSVAMMMSNMTVTATEIETEQQTEAVTVRKGEVFRIKRGRSADYV